MLQQAHGVGAGRWGRALCAWLHAAVLTAAAAAAAVGDSSGGSGRLGAYDVKFMCPGSVSKEMIGCVGSESCRGDLLVWSCGHRRVVSQVSAARTYPEELLGIASLHGHARDETHRLRGATQGRDSCSCCYTICPVSEVSAGTTRGRSQDHSLTPCTHTALLPVPSIPADVA